MSQLFVAAVISIVFAGHSLLVLTSYPSAVRRDEKIELGKALFLISDSPQIALGTGLCLLSFGAISRQKEKKEM